MVASYWYSAWRDIYRGHFLQEWEGFREKLKRARKFGEVGCWDVGFPWLQVYGSSKAKLYKRAGLLIDIVRKWLLRPTC